MQTESNRSYHRLSLRTWENPEGPEGWAVKDRKTGKVIFKGGGRDGSGDMVDVIREFLSLRLVGTDIETLLCREIDSCFPEPDPEENA